MIANVASIAYRLFKTVANMYSPFSVNALGRALLFDDRFAVSDTSRQRHILRGRISVCQICEAGLPVLV